MKKHSLILILLFVTLLSVFSTDNNKSGSISLNLITDDVVFASAGFTKDYESALDITKDENDFALDKLGESDNDEGKINLIQSNDGLKYVNESPVYVYWRIYDPKALTLKMAVGRMYAKGSSSKDSLSLQIDFIRKDNETVKIKSSGNPSDQEYVDPIPDAVYTETYVHEPNMLKLDIGVIELKITMEDVEHIQLGSDNTYNGNIYLMWEAIQ